MINTHTTSISVEDLKKVITLSGHEPEIVDFAVLAETSHDNKGKEEEKK